MSDAETWLREKRRNCLQASGRRFKSCCAHLRSALSAGTEGRQPTTRQPRALAAVGTDLHC